MLPEENARVKVDKQLIDAGWNIVSRDEYVPKSASAVKEALIPMPFKLSFIVQYHLCNLIVPQSRQK